jgi:Flp pilus assembly protein TadG
MAAFPPRRQPAARLRGLARDARGLALTEFALSLPLVLFLGLTGAEYANWIITKMRVSQIALQIADNASRMGDGSSAGAKTVSETDINETFTGGQLQSSNLALATQARVILSDLEPTDTSASPTAFKIQWQRCYGAQTHPSGYGVQGATNLAGIGPTGSQVTAQPRNATMFVEVFYVYKPLFSAAIAPSRTFVEVASMAVRDQRNLNIMPTNAENATVGTC